MQDKKMDNIEKIIKEYDLQYLKCSEMENTTIKPEFSLYHRDLIKYFCPLENKKTTLQTFGRHFNQFENMYFGDLPPMASIVMENTMSTDRRFMHAFTNVIK